MKILFLILVMVSPLMAVESRWRDGKIEFSVSQVNGKTAWTTKEKNDLISKYTPFASTSPISVIDDSPTKEELAISTSASFKSYTEYKEALAGKVSYETILEIRQKLDVAGQMGDQGKITNLNSQLSYLKNQAVKVGDAGVDLSK